MAFLLRKQTYIICELCACTLNERELVNWTESTGNVNEGLQRYSRSLLSNSGSTFTTLSACLFVAEVSSTGAGVTFSGGGVDVPVSAIQKKRNFTVPNLFEKFSLFYIFIHSSHWLSTLNAPVNTCTDTSWKNIYNLVPPVLLPLRASLMKQATLERTVTGSSFLWL